MPAGPARSLAPPAVIVGPVEPVLGEIVVVVVTGAAVASEIVCSAAGGAGVVTVVAGTTVVVTTGTCVVTVSVTGVLTVVVVTVCVSDGASTRAVELGLPMGWVLVPAEIGAVVGAEEAVDEPVAGGLAGIAVEPVDVPESPAAWRIRCPCSGALPAGALSVTVALSGAGALSTVVACVGVDTGAWLIGETTGAELLGMVGAGAAVSVTTGALVIAVDRALTAPAGLPALCLGAGAEGSPYALVTTRI